VGLGYKKDLRDFDKEEMENILKKSMGSVKLPIAKVQGRKVIGFSNYEEAWAGDLKLKFNKENCNKCSICSIEKNCPAQAFSKEEGFLKNCIYCGICLKFCPFGAISGYLGKIKNYKIKMRHSSLYKALKICELLKNI
jgi:flavoprotein